MTKRVWKGWIGKKEKGDKCFEWNEYGELDSGLLPIIKRKGIRSTWTGTSFEESEWPPKRVTVTVEVENE